jgi:hypothetical protein
MELRIGNRSGYLEGGLMITLARLKKRHPIIEVTKTSDLNF